MRFSFLYLAIFSIRIMKGVIYMFRFFIRTKKKSDPILEMLREENERLDKILVERQKETAKVEEEIAKAENALRALGYTDKDLKRLVQKGKMKVIKSEDED